MSTMYDSIMGMPLFKGVSHNQLSDFLEKTHIQFLNYTPGMEVVKEGEDCKYVKFIITGRVKFVYKNRTNNFTVSEIVGPGNVLWPHHLYGMDTTYPATGVALGNVSIMQFSKEQYFKAIQSGMIFLLNYLNYLSYHSQLSQSAFEMLNTGTLREYLALIVKTVTHTKGEEITIGEYIAVFENILNIENSELIRQLEKLKAEGLIEYDSKTIKIIARKNFLESAL